MKLNKKIIIVLTLIIIILFSTIIFAELDEDKNLKIKNIPYWKEFKQSHENKGIIDFNEKAQRTELITNFRHDTKTRINNEKDAEQVAKKFFIENKELF